MDLSAITRPAPHAASEANGTVRLAPTRPFLRAPVTSAARLGAPEILGVNHLAPTRPVFRCFATDRLRATTSGSRELNEEARRLWN